MLCFICHRLLGIISFTKPTLWPDFLIVPLLVLYYCVLNTSIYNFLPKNALYMNFCSVRSPFNLILYFFFLIKSLYHAHLSKYVNNAINQNSYLHNSILFLFYIIANNSVKTQLICKQIKVWLKNHHNDSSYRRMIRSEETSSETLCGFNFFFLRDNWCDVIDV